ncbi:MULTISPECIES: type II toxin-antitoxin system MqsA family antitoxin [unclassified Halomonas]|nr:MULTISPECIES: type II toxin-antitoxin system MqsA family antitoxin [unclassified Halomonas]
MTLTRGEVTDVIKNVPADICKNCGEYYHSDEISRKTLTLAERSYEA